MTVDRYELALALVGAAALLAAWVPAYLSRRPLSLPIVLVGMGAAVFALPLGLPTPDPRSHPDLVERATELVVIVSLMGAGLKIDRPFSWRGWGTTWRMLAVAMPVTIGLTWALGVVVGGFSAVAALLLGAVLAPTDPVLASDVQVGEPTVDEEEGGPGHGLREDEVRLTLTSEGGLNDALAFPFVYAAIRVADHGWAPGGWLLPWLGWDLVGRVLIGAVVGWLVGRLLGVVSFRPPGRLSALAETPQGFVAVAATLLAYGVTELLQGYGFLAVFVAAVVLRGSERRHEFHAELHRFSEQIENLLVVALLLLLGGSLVSGVLDGLTWSGAALAVLLVFLVRPASGRIALAGAHLTGVERWAIAFFGIRGLGSIYYLAYALSQVDLPEADGLWAVVTLTLVISIMTHGMAATPVMERVDRIARRRRRGRRRPPVPAAERSDG